MPSNPTELTEADFGWFNYGKYSTERLYSLGHKGWLRVLGDRLLLRGLVENGMSGSALQFFKDLSVDPLGPIGFDDVRPIEGPHPSDTSTVFLARSFWGTYMARTVEANQLPPLAPYDVAVRDLDQPMAGSIVTLHVNLGANRQKIREDFGRWLNAMDDVHPPPKRRDYTGDAVYADWIEHDYLPYFDLRLYAEARGLGLSGPLAMKMLRLMDDPDGPDLLKVRQRSWGTFNFATWWDMWAQLRPQA